MSEKEVSTQESALETVSRCAKQYAVEPLVSLDESTENWREMQEAMTNLVIEEYARTRVPLFNEVHFMLGHLENAGVRNDRAHSIATALRRTMVGTLARRIIAMEPSGSSEDHTIKYVTSQTTKAINCV